MSKSKHYLLSFTTLFLTKKGYVLMFNQHQNAQNSNNFPLAFETWNRYDALALRDMKTGTKVRQVVRRVDNIKDVTVATEGDAPIELRKSGRRYLEGVREVLNESLLGSLEGDQEDLRNVELYRRLPEIIKGQTPKYFRGSHLLPDLEIPIKVMENGNDTATAEGYEIPVVGEQIRQELTVLLEKLGQEDAIETLTLLRQSGHNQAMELADTLFKDAEKTSAERLLKLQHGARVLDEIKADFLKQVVESLLRKSEEGRIIEVTEVAEKDILESPVVTLISMGYPNEYQNPSSKMVDAEVTDVSMTKMPEHISYADESRDETSINIKSDSRNDVTKPDRGTSVKGESRNQLALSETARKVDEHTEGLKEKVESFRHLQEEGQPEDASHGVRTVIGRYPDLLEEEGEIRQEEGTVEENPAEARSHKEGKEQTLLTDMTKVTKGELGEYSVTDGQHHGDMRSVEFYKSILIPSLLDIFEETSTPTNYGELNLTAKAIKHLSTLVQEYEGGKGVKDTVIGGYETSDDIAPNYGNLTKSVKVDLAIEQAEVKEYAQANKKLYEGEVEYLNRADFKTVHLGALTLLTDWGESTLSDATMNLTDGAEYRRIIQADVASVGMVKTITQGDESLQTTEGNYTNNYLTDLLHSESFTEGAKEVSLESTERMYQGDNNAPDVELHWTEVYDNQVVDTEREKIEGFRHIPKELEVGKVGNDLGKRVTFTLDTETTRVNYIEKKEETLDLIFYGSAAGEKVEQDLEVNREVGDSSRRKDTTHDVGASKLEVFDILDPVYDLFNTYSTSAEKPQIVYEVKREKLTTSHKPESNLEITFDMQDVSKRVDDSRAVILDVTDKASGTTDELDISIEFTIYGETEERLDVYVEKVTDTAEVSSEYGVDSVESSTAYKETTQGVSVEGLDNASVNNAHEIGLGDVLLTTHKTEHEIALATRESADLNNEQDISLEEPANATLERTDEVSINHTKAGNGTTLFDVEIDGKEVAESKSGADVFVDIPEITRHKATYDVLTNDGDVGENSRLEDILLKGGETARQENTKVVEVIGGEVAQTHKEEQITLQGYEKAVTGVKDTQDIEVSGAEFGEHSVTETTVLEYTETAITETEKDVVVERDLHATGQTDYDVYNEEQERANGAGEFDVHLGGAVRANSAQMAELYDEVVDLGTGDSTTDTVVEWYDFATGDETTDVYVEQAEKGKVEPSADLEIESTEYGGQDTAREVINETSGLADVSQEVETVIDSIGNAEQNNQRDIVVELPSLADGGEKRDVVLESPSLAKSETVVEVFADKEDLAESKNTSDIVIETGELADSSQEVTVVVEMPDLADSSTTTDVTIEGSDLADSGNTSDVSVENASLADSHNGYEVEVEGADLADSSSTTDVSIEEPDLAEPSNTFVDVVEEEFDSVVRGRNRKLDIIGEELGDKDRDTLIDLIDEEEFNRASDKGLDIADEVTADKGSDSELQILEEEETEKEAHALLDIFEEEEVNKGGSTIIEVEEDEQVTPVTDSYITIEEDELSDKQTSKFTTIEDDDLGDAVSTKAIVIDEDDNAERIKVLRGMVEDETEGYRERVFNVGVEGEEEGYRPDREFPIDIEEDDTGVGKLPVDPPWEEPETKGKMWLIMGKQYPAWNNWSPKKTR